MLIITHNTVHCVKGHYYIRSYIVAAKSQCFWGNRALNKDFTYAGIILDAFAILCIRLFWKMIPGPGWI